MKFSKPGDWFVSNSSPTYNNPFSLPQLPIMDSRGFETSPSSGTIANNFNKCAFCYASLSWDQTITNWWLQVKAQFNTFDTNTVWMWKASTYEIIIPRNWYYIITVWADIESVATTKCAYSIEVNWVIKWTDWLNPFTWIRLWTVNIIEFLTKWDKISCQSVWDTLYNNAATFMRVIEYGSYAV